MSSLEAEHCQSIEEIVSSRDILSSLPDDLLIHILLFVSTKDAVSTMILSKRWRFIWSMVPKLEFKDTTCKSLGKFLELHKAPVLESLSILFSQKTDVEEVISNSVDRFVRTIKLDLLWTAEPTTLPKSLYRCKTLVELTLCNKILIDVPSLACLPSLKTLNLILVEFKDEMSLRNLVLGCSVKARSGVDLYVSDTWRNNVEVVNKSRYVPSILVLCNIVDKCSRVFPFVRSLYLALTNPMVLDFCSSDFVFPHLQGFTLRPLGHLWLNLLRMVLNKSPNLKALCIHSVGEFPYPPEFISFPYPPEFVPRCLSSHLQKFSWYGYSGKEQEKQVMKYILANSKCLTKAKVILKSSTWILKRRL